MLRYLVKRILFMVPVFLAVSILLFAIVKMMPGDPVRNMLSPDLKPEVYQRAYDAMYIKLGLDKSIPEQYVRWMVNMLQFDFGFSSKYNKPVVDVIKGPIQNTLYLNIIVTLLQISIILPVGIRCASKRLSLFDNTWTVGATIFYSMPSFFVALSLIYTFALKLKWLPVGGLPNGELLKGADYFIAFLRHATLPAVTLTIIGVAGSIRYVRNAMIDSLSQDYIRTARSKGLNERVVVYSHAFRNALIPVSTIIVGSFFTMFVGSPITESVFAWDGLGRVLVTALNNRDMMLITTINWLFAVMFILGNFAADIVYSIIDPRIKLK